MGSTIPERLPYRNAFPLLTPSARKGREIIAPSGKFWIAMPRASASAPVWVMPLTIWDNRPAYTTPTAIPSGILCSVTANTSFTVRDRELDMPSDSLLSLCRWGMMWSSSRINSTPNQNPTRAGRKASLSMAFDCSMAGIIRLQMEAATMTPAANPVKARSTFQCRLPRIKNTQPAPSTVPIKGIRRACNISIGIIYLVLQLCPNYTQLW